MNNFQGEKKVQRIFCAALLLAMSSAHAEDQASFYGFVPSGFPSKRENPARTAMKEGIDTCLFYYEGGFFTSYAFEEDALKKEKRFGRESLDQDDMKWIMAVENRREACLGLLYRVKKLSWLDRLRYWWQH